MAKFTTTQTFVDAEQVTSTKLNAIITGLSASTDLAADSTITIISGAIKVGVISTGNIATDAVTTAKILDANVTTAKINDSAVTTGKIADSAVTTAKIADANVSWAKTLTADRAVQADMQSETASHYVSPDVLKYHPGIAKAYGRVSATSGSAALTGAYNVTSATESGNDRVIALAVTMANTNYVVHATYEDGTSVGNAPGIHTKTTTGFSIGVTEAPSRFVTFTVFGQRA